MMELTALRHDIESWLENMASGLEPGRFRFCADNVYVPVTGIEGQVSTCFAMKAAWQSGIWDKWSEDRKDACIKFVSSFQKEDGCFYDDWLKRAGKPGWRDWVNLLLGHKDYASIRDIQIRNVRAETRQSASTLTMVDKKPPCRLPIELESPDDVLAYFESFNWNIPWSAGSHLSHQMMFLTINHDYFNISENYDDIIDKILLALEGIRDPLTGTWFRGNTPDTIKINGAMKVFSGLQWLNRPYPDCRNIVDFALKQPFQTSGCSFLNRLFVIQQALKGSPKDYRQKDVEMLAVQAWEEILKFRKPDGGFSFHQDKSQPGYYSAKVSKGKPISDMHGTVMMCWAVALVMDLLGEKAPEGSEEWKIHKA